MSVSKALGRIFAEWNDRVALVTCPSCGCTAVHLGPVRVHQDRLLTTVERRGEFLDPHWSPSGRGSTVNLSLWCENGCTFALHLTFGERKTYAEVQPTGYFDPQDPQRPAELWRV